MIISLGNVQADEPPQVIKGPVEFVSKEGDYSIQIPEHWEYMKEQMGADIIAVAPQIDPKDLFRENLNIISAKFDIPISKEEYYSLNLKSLNNLLTDFDLEESKEIQIGGVDARKLVFTHRVGVVNVRVEQYLVLVDQKAIVISFTSDTLEYPKIKDQFARIASSFKVN
jgi:hypothetical protein